MDAGVCSFAVCWLEPAQPHDAPGPGFHVIVAGGVHVAINPAGRYIRAALTPAELGIVDDR